MTTNPFAPTKFQMMIYAMQQDVGEINEKCEITWKRYSLVMKSVFKGVHLNSFRENMA